MPAFGKDGILKAEQIRQVANYVRTLAKLDPEPGVDVAAGKKIFADNCAACHGDDGKGNIEMGAPNLTTKIWLYGSDIKDLTHTITYARNSTMPAWGKRLDPVTIKALALYVHSLGGGTVTHRRIADDCTTTVHSMRRRRRSTPREFGGPIDASNGSCCGSRSASTTSCPSFAGIAGRMSRARRFSSTWRIPASISSSSSYGRRRCTISPAS